MWRKGTLILAVALAGISAGSADTVFNNFGDNFTYNVGTGATISKGAPINTTWVQGDQFTPTASGTLSDVYFAMGFVVGTNFVTMTMVNDDNGSPGTTQIWTADFNGQMGNFGNNNPPLHWTGSGPALVQGTPYWLIAASADNSWLAWNYNSIGDTGPHAYSQNGGPFNVGTGTRDAFRIDVSTGPVVCRGDANCDGEINFSDINPFVLALSNFAQWQAQFPNCPVGNVDVNGDGQVNFNDINPFVALLSGGGTCH